MANAHDQAVAIAARHITEQYERIAEQRKRVAELEEQGRKKEAVEARRHLADLFQWLALLRKEEAAAKEKAQEARALEASTPEGSVSLADVRTEDEDRRHRKERASRDRSSRL